MTIISAVFTSTCGGTAVLSIVVAFFCLIHAAKDFLDLLFDNTLHVFTGRPVPSFSPLITDVAAFLAIGAVLLWIAYQLSLWSGGDIFVALSR